MRKSITRRGEGKFGFFLAVIILAAAVFAALRFVPVYVASYDLKDTIRQEVQFAANHSDKQIITTILQKGVELELPIGEKNIEAVRTNSRFSLRVHFTKNIDLALFTYEFKFDEKQTAPLF